MGKDKKSKKSKKSHGGHSKRPPKDEDILFDRGYKLEKTLGVGAYAIVKLGFSERHNRPVAIKVILKKKAPEEYLQKFLPREIEICKMLKHPNIVYFFETLDAPDKLFMVMELADNGDVLDAIQKEGKIAENTSGKWFYQTVDAIMYCHGKGVVHRDLKCENMLLDRKNDVKLADFGFAKIKHQPGQMSETYCGSFAYACPEILRGVPYEPRFADVWSLGIILFTMLTGRLPYDDKNLKILLVQTQGNPFYPPEVPIPEPTKVCINKMLLPMPARQPLSVVREDPWFKKYDKGRQQELVVTELEKPAGSSKKDKGEDKHGSKKKSKK